MYSKHEKIRPCVLKEFFEQRKARTAKYTDQGIHFLGLFKDGEYIYPDVLQRNLKITRNESNYLLSELESDGIVEKYYQRYCISCGKPVGNFFTKKLGIETYCPECDEPLDDNRCITVYKVLHS